MCKKSYCRIFNARKIKYCPIFRLSEQKNASLISVKFEKKTGKLLSTHGVDICQHCLAAKNVSNKNTRKKVL